MLTILKVNPLAYGPEIDALCLNVTLAYCSFCTEKRLRPPLVPKLLQISRSHFNSLKSFNSSYNMYFIQQIWYKIYPVQKYQDASPYQVISSYFKLFLREQHEKSKQQRIFMSNFLIWLPNLSVGYKRNCWVCFFESLVMLLISHLAEYVIWNHKAGSPWFKD